MKLFFNIIFMNQPIQRAVKFFFNTSVVIIFVSSFILISSSQSHARDIIVLTSQKNQPKIQQIIKILTTKINIPRRLITVRYQKQACKKIDSAIIQICITGYEITFPVLKRDVIRRAFKIFIQKDSL